MLLLENSLIALLGSMAEPSLLCVNCARPPPPHRRTWNRCVRCAELNLPSTYYCGPECMEAHWPKHKEYHKVQTQRQKEVREGPSGYSCMDHGRSMAKSQARIAETTGDERCKRTADAMALATEGDYHASAKAFRKVIKEWPDEPSLYHNLAVVLDNTGHYTEAASMFLKVMELCEDGIERWAVSAAAAFGMLKMPDCAEVPKPEWWNDEGLKALSARVAAIAPNYPNALAMRGSVLSGRAIYAPSWNPAPRTAAEIKEAATWFRRAAKVGYSQAATQRNEERARMCDAVADPMLAEEEAEAAKARAAAEAEAAEALKVAEAKATAVAEELLLEEEEEKQQAAMASSKAGKTKQGKGKKGKGKR